MGKRFPATAEPGCGYWIWKFSGDLLQRYGCPSQRKHYVHEAIYYWPENQALFWKEDSQWNYGGRRPCMAEWVADV